MLSLDLQLATYRTFHGFVKNSLPLDEAAEACADEDKARRSQWMTVKQALSNGVGLSQAMRGAELWPENTLLAVASAERTQRLEPVFAILVKLTQSQRRVKATIKKQLFAPAIYVVMAIALVFGSTLGIYPLMSSSIKKRKGIVVVLDQVHDIMQIALVPTVAGLLAIVAFCIYAATSQTGRNLMFRVLDRLGAWGSGLRSISLSHWSAMVNLLATAGDIHDDETLAIATKGLPEVHAEPFGIMLSDLRRLGSLQAAVNPQRWSPADPRRSWPPLFRVCLRSAAATGKLSEAVGQVGDDMLELGLIDIEKAVARLSTIGLVMAMLGASTVIAVYSLTQLAQVMARL